MRAAGQIARTPRQWKDHQEEERRRTAAALLRMLREARERGELWIQWIDRGCPPLSAEEYARHQAERGGAARRAPRRA